MANACVWKIAKDYQDETVCEYWVIESTFDKVNKDLCYKNLARSKRDLSLCDNIVGSTLKAECLNVLNEE